MKIRTKKNELIGVIQSDFHTEQHTNSKTKNSYLGVSASPQAHHREARKHKWQDYQEISRGIRLVVPRPNVTFKRLTETEKQDKRAEGLCFRCDEKFS